MLEEPAPIRLTLEPLDDYIVVEELATVVWLACCHLDLIVRRDSWTLQTVAAPILVAIYAAATRKPSIPRMAVVSLAFAVPAADFLAGVVG